MVEMLSKGLVLRRGETPQLEQHQMARLTDLLANITDKVNAQKVENAEIGTLHCADTFKQGIAQKGIIAFLCIPNLPQQHLRNRPQGNSR